jgi:hypothetical protein
MLALAVESYLIRLAGIYDADAMLRPHFHFSIEIHFVLANTSLSTVKTEHF